jgi:hypothetical protein
MLMSMLGLVIMENWRKALMEQLSNVSYPNQQLGPF